MPRDPSMAARPIFVVARRQLGRRHPANHTTRFGSRILGLPLPISWPSLAWR